MALKVALVGNAPPRLCGIATFTSDLRLALRAQAYPPATSIVAMSEKRGVHDYPAGVIMEIEAQQKSEYVAAAERLNAARVDIVSLQHEYGIYGGESGSYIRAFLAALKAPVVSTLHTVLAAPNLGQRRVLGSIIRKSAKVVVMAERARAILRDLYATPSAKIHIIPHGAPDMPITDPELDKGGFGLSGRAVALTFGLLSPSKGIEVMIAAMAHIVRRAPNAIYVVLGATHPSLVAVEGERYRRSLEDLVAALGLQEHVRFVDEFVDQPLLLRYIAAADVYVTPYLNQEQMTSGTLSYSFALGKAIVSTPYWHAQELLDHGLGLIVPFGDVGATAHAVGDLLTDHRRRDAMRQRAYQSSRSMVWAQTGRQYLDVFASALHTRVSAQASAS
ncbi:MAG: glycosyltransferase family 4 protein [Caulobacterales bacterium]